MSTEKQIEANRLNAQHSTGPTTEEGKKRSALNACRHGLTGQVVVLPEEDREAFDAFMLALVATFDVANAMEQQLAQSYAHYQWRINRASAIEENMFTLGNIKDMAGNMQLEDPRVHNAMCNAVAFRGDGQTFNRLTMYAQRLVNQGDRILSQLKALQSERRQREQRDLQQAVAIYKAHRIAGEPFDPKSNGFVCTIAQIERYLRRKCLEDSQFIAEEAARNRKKAA
jgi:hypothetical protein